MTAHISVEGQKMLNDGSYDVIVPKHLHIKPTCGGLWRSAFFMERKYAVVKVNHLASFFEKIKCKFTREEYKPHVYVKQVDFFTAQDNVLVDGHKAKLLTEYRLNVKNPAKPFVLIMLGAIFYIVFVSIMMGHAIAPPVVMYMCAISYGLAGLMV
jgi:hypothetical protein